MTTKTRSLKAKYQEEIIPALTEKFGYKNINQVPKRFCEVLEPG